MRFLWGKSKQIAVYRPAAEIRNSEFGIRNYPSFARGSAAKKRRFMPHQKALITKTSKKRGGEITIKPFVPAQFRIPNSEFRIEPINPNLKFLMQTKPHRTKQARCGFLCLFVLPSHAAISRYRWKSQCSTVASIRRGAATGSAYRTDRMRPLRAAMGALTTGT